MSLHLTIIAAVAALGVTMLSPELAVSQSLGIVNQQAPELGVQQWVTLPKGKKDLKLSDYEGKVVYLFSWQKW